MSENKKITLSETIGGKSLIIETGHIAEFAAGAVMAQIGDTVVLSTSVVSDKPKEGFPSFTPLTVDYRERTYAAGKIPGGFFKREGRPRDKETLASRLTDRSVRPLFPEGYYTETMVLNVVMSADTENDSDVIALNGASAALAISEVPWNGPVGAVRVGRLEGKLVFFPTFEERENLELEFVVSGTEEGLLMVEGGAREVSEDVMLEALTAAHEEIKKICRAIKGLAQKIGKKKREHVPTPVPAELKGAVEGEVKKRIADMLSKHPRKSERDAQVDEIKQWVIESQKEKHEDVGTYAGIIVEDVLYYESRKMVLDTGIRADGRKTDEVRPISIQVPALPRTHGSAIFTRGQTQAMATVTLGTPIDMQIMDELEGEYKERFMLHYNFPPFSTGEVKRLMGPGRREIGHGALARRALAPLLPDEEKFPYTVRIVSDILASNGSSSMASVCGGSLALFDAGVPMPAACAGIAMGLITDGKRHKVISDIMGLEDHLGDMDFKVAGTKNGITAFQMDLKVGGVTLEIMKECLEQAKRGRLHILSKMDEALPEPRKELSKWAPRMFRVVIPIDKIGALIGPGGKNIRKIQEETGAEVEVEDDGSVYISGLDSAGVEAAKKMVEYVTAEAEVGKIYKGKVVSVVEFGAFVEILPGKEGLCHISQLAENRVEKTSDVVKEGDEIEVKVLEVDNMGKIRLSRKAVLKPGSENEGGDKRPPRNGPSHGGGRREGGREGRPSFRGGGRR
jgi:polyribonucleotide nucleotidyltransferase